MCTARLFTKLRDELSETQITPAGENGCFDSEEKKDDMKAQSTNNPPGLRPGDMGYRAGAGETFQREQMDEEEKDRGATIPFDACHSLLDVYRAFLRPFAEVLVGMEREGVQVDVNERLPKVCIKLDMNVAFPPNFFFHFIYLLFFKLLLLFGFLTNSFPLLPSYCFPCI